MTTVHKIACPIPFPLQTANCYYIHDTHPMLIDTGVHSAAALNAVEAGIEKAGGTLAGLERIVLTHGHTDHVGLAGKLAAVSKAAVYLHRWDSPKIISGDKAKTALTLERFGRFLEAAGVPGSLAGAIVGGFAARVHSLVSPLKRFELLDGGETFDFDDFQLRVVHSPGHTAGSICLVNAQRAELFAGDTLLEKITPNPVVEVNLPPIGQEYRSIARYRQSLATIALLGNARVLPGHGPAFADAAGRAAALAEHFNRRRQFVVRRLQRMGSPLQADRAMTLYDLTPAIFPGLEGLDLFLGLSEVFAYLQLLETEGLIESRPDGRLCRYRLAPRG
jgi:glyoxylase-like metal-dependent hydrolase (beta-lactamase superfamily II)